MTLFSHQNSVLAAMVAILILPSTPAPARTIKLDARHCDRMAVLSNTAPMHGWAAPAGHRCCFSAVQPRSGHSWHHSSRWGSTLVNDLIQINPERRFLISFALKDVIPEGHRVVHAQLTLPITYAPENEPRFYLWRILLDWGPGVCHLYRTTHPEPVAWTSPGATGLSSDRATHPTDIVRLPPSVIQFLGRGRLNQWSRDKIREVSINVTEDVELWHSGAAENNGWLFTVEDPGVSIEMLSPAWDGRDRWTLRITHEPEPRDP